MSEQHDDAEVEVSSLDLPVGPSTTATGDGSSQQGTTDTESLPTNLHRVSLAAPRPQRQRVLRAIGVLAILGILLSTLLLIPIGNRVAVLRLLIPPTPSPAARPQPGDDTFLWEHAVPWGRLLIDGKPGPALVGASLSDDPVPQTHAPFRLSRGRHTLEYNAALFPSLRCTVSVPYSPDDTCPLGTEGVPPGPDRLTRLLDLLATTNRLSTHERQALVATAQERLTALATGLPQGSLTAGDHFAMAPVRSPRPEPHCRWKRSSRWTTTRTALLVAPA